MKTKIYHNPRCSKSRETLAILSKKKEDIEIIEYLNNSPTKKELYNLLKMLNISPEKLVRKGEAIFKEQFKGKKLSDDEWIAALAKFPKLIERPIVVKNGKAVIGRPPSAVIEIL